jgi:hypothetical protein
MNYIPSSRVVGALLAAVVLSTSGLSAALATDTPGASAGSHLARGQRAIVTVVSAKWVNETGIAIHSGETYAIRPLPNQKWYDLTIPTTAAGFNSKTNAIMEPFTNQRHLPSADWLELCGAVGTEPPFPVGDHEVVIPAKGTPRRHSPSGPLRLFANDVSWGYFDNFGSIKVEIRRLK